MSVTEPQQPGLLLGDCQIHYLEICSGAIKNKSAYMDAYIPMCQQTSNFRAKEYINFKNFAIFNMLVYLYVKTYKQACYISLQKHQFTLLLAVYEEASTSIVLIISVLQIL